MRVRAQLEWSIFDCIPFRFAEEGPHTEPVPLYAPGTR